MSLRQQSDGRQLSITDFFGPSVKKRKPSSKASEQKNSAIITIMDVAEKANKLCGSNGSTDRPNPPLQNVDKCSEDDCDNSTEPILSSPTLNDVTDEDTSSQTISKASQDLRDAIIAERTEKVKQFLKKDIVEDDDALVDIPVQNNNTSNTGTKFEAKKSNDDALLIYDSPDMLADTFPTPDFDLNIDSQMSDLDRPAERWMGTPKSLLKRAPGCLAPLPKLEPTRHHTVLIDTNYFDLGAPPPSISTYIDAWDSSHVRLPCSPKNLFPIAEGSRLTSRWELIENALLRDIKTAKDLEAAIKCYNVRLKQPYHALDALINEVYTEGERNIFFTETLPEMVKLALSLPTLVTQPIPLLRSQQRHCLTLSQQQCACLLANAFFCTFPRRNSTSPESEYRRYPTINFNKLLTGTSTVNKRSSIVEKLKTLLHYFQRIITEMPSGTVTFERKVCQDFPVWSKSPCKLGGIHVTSHGLIEDSGKGMLQMDFANKYIGGGVLSSGMVQEEILFSIFPELIVSRLFCEMLDDNECINIIGAERFSNYSGYAQSYKFEGNHNDSNTRDTWRRKASYIVALDATYFSKPNEQYKAGSVRRELNKLYCGFQEPLHPDHAPAVATGNWGCGAFRGNPMFKAVLQMMGAAVVCRDLCYFTFGDETFMEKLHNMHLFITSQDLGVSDLWRLICQYNEQRVLPLMGKQMPVDDDIFEFIKETICRYDASTDEEG